MSSAKRAWMAVAALTLLVSAAIGTCARWNSSPRAAGKVGPMIYAGSPEQTKRTLELLGELPEDAPGIAYIDVEALRKLQASPLASLLGTTASQPAGDREYQRFVRETGFNYMQDLDRVAIAFWTASPDGKNQATPPDNRAFVVADGRFDEGKIRGYALETGKAQASGSQTIYEIPGKPPVALALLSPTRIAIASGAGSTQFLLNTPPAAHDPAFQGRVDRVTGAALFAILRVDQLPPSFNANWHTSPQIQNLVRSIRSLTFAAQPQGDALEFVLDAESDSPQNALTITTLLEISRAGASAAFSNSKSTAHLSNSQSALIDALIHKSRITQDDRWARIAFDLTPEMLDKRDPATPTAEGSPRSPANSESLKPYNK